MTLYPLEAGQRIDASREQPVVCIPVYGAYEHFVPCLRSVLEHTSETVPILVADDASPEKRIEGFLYELEAAGALTHHLWYLRQRRNLGFVGNVNSAFVSAYPGDAVVINSDCVVSDGWLDSLREAAYSNTRVATASTLTNHGTILSVPQRNAPASQLPHGWNAERMAASIRSNALRLYPTIPTALGHCFYVRRSALELIGPLDETFSPGYGEEVDFSQRCLLHGLSHVVADDVFVLHRGAASFADESSSIQQEHEELIRARYPYYERLVKDTEGAVHGPLARALGSARRAIRGTSVTIDGRVLGPELMGTQVVVLEMIRAVQRTQRVRLRVLIPTDLGDYARPVLDEVPEIEQITVDDDTQPREPSDVVHRPYQVSFQEDLDTLLRFGERLVITHLDLIAYDNPGYFPSYEHWERYRRVTRRALALADRVSFISRTAADDALAAELLEASRLAVVYPGTDHRLIELQPEPIAPHLGDDPLPEPYLLYLGTDYRHKNRLFALEVLRELKRRHEWPGRLVLAGPHVPFGSSLADEAEFLARHPDITDSVVDLPSVTEGEKAWLMKRAGAVIYPTLYEGFGLIPFEAAAAGVPCFFAPHSSLAETLPTQLARIVPWDAAATAGAVLDVLVGRGRDELVAGIRAASAQYTWDGAAARMVELYEEAATAPGRESAALARDVQRLDRDAQRLEKLEARYFEFREAIGEDGLSLVGPDAVLPAAMRRPLLAISTRRWLRAPIFGALRLPYAVAHRILRRNRAPQGST
jgi:glycosyltransferase involved in cell wall biosynthesis